MKKKGFTLIELLAVLVVLAILALIAVPIVISIINNVRENSVKRSIESYGRAVENAVGLYALEHSELEYSQFPNTLSSYKIEYSGQEVTCDKLIIENGIITLKGCRVDGVDKVFKYINKKVSEDVYQVYSIGNTFTLDGYSYYIIADSSKTQDYVVALKAEPLTVNEVNTYGGEYVNKYTSSSRGRSWNNNGYGGITFYTSEDCRYNGNTSIISGCLNTYEDSDIKHVVDNWASHFADGVLKEVDDYMARLITYNEYNNIPASNTWKYNSQYRYWTMTANNDQYHSSVHEVYNSDHIYTRSVWAEGGDWVVRPVINVYKNAITN